MSFRSCTETGWQRRDPTEVSTKGWTNYTLCFPELVQSLFGNLYGKDSNATQNKFETAQWTRYLEIAGFSTSLVALIISLAIFMSFRSLRNHRTRIHKSLFVALIVQVVIRLILYFDQAIVRNWYGEQDLEDESIAKGIESVPYLCETFYVLLEYSISCTFMWMLVEGIHLRRMVTATALRDSVSYVTFYIIGWGVPVVITAIWAAMTAIHYQSEKVNKCWYGYNFNHIYWILQVPRLAVILFNMLSLIHIMSVLVVKLRRSATNEMQKIRKAVRAALVLLPLLGITNILNMIEGPLKGSALTFAAWSYSTHFFRSFQGFFIALIYCFYNNEVRQVVHKRYTTYMAVKEYRRRNRDTFREMTAEPPIRTTEDEECPISIPMRTFRCTEGPPSMTQHVAEIEIGAGPSHEAKETVVQFTEPPAKPTIVGVKLKQLPTGPDRSTYHGTPRHVGVIIRNLELKVNPPTVNN